MSWEKTKPIMLPTQREYGAKKEREMKDLSNTAQMTNQRDMLGACIAVSV